MRSQIFILLGSLVCKEPSFSCYLQDFILDLQYFYYCISECGSSCTFFLLAVCWAALICMLMFFIKFMKLSVIISQTIFYLFPLYLRIPSKCMTLLLMVVYISHRLFIFLSVFGIAQSLLIYLLVHWFFLLPAEICYWVSLLSFKISILYFSTPNVSFSGYFSLLMLYI